MGKQQLNVLVDTGTVAALQEKARDLGVSQGDLVALFIRRGLSSAKPGALEEWAKATRGGSRRTWLMANERHLLEGLAELTRRALAARSKVRRWTTHDLQLVTPLPVREIYRGALGLRTLGLATLDPLSAEMDRWNRPKAWAVGLTPAGMTRERLSDASPDSRSEMGQPAPL